MFSRTRTTVLYCTYIACTVTMYTYMYMTNLILQLANTVNTAKYRASEGVDKNGLKFKSNVQ